MSAKQKPFKAIYEILSVKDFNNISVSGLCKVSNVHRTTFYAYYDNLYELLIDVKDEVLKDFYSNFSKDTKNRDLLDKEFLIPYFKFIKKNSSLFEVFFKNAEILGREESFENIY